MSRWASTGPGSCAARLKTKSCWSTRSRFTGSTEGPPHHELFVRMRDRSGSIIMPGAFLPTAERHDRSRNSIHG